MKHFILINIAFLLSTVVSYSQKNHPDGSTKPIPQGIGQPNSKFNCLELDASKSGIAKNYSNPRCVIIQPGYSFTATSGQPLCIGIDRETGLLGQGLYQINATRTYIPLLSGLSESQIPTRPRDQVRTSIQYMDGLGRPIQQVAKQASQNGSDIIKIIEYDKYGRQPKSYLAYVADQVNDGGYRLDGKHEQFNFYQSANGIPHTDYAFAITEFEASPLNHKVAEMAPGENNAGANRKTSHKILTSTTAFKRVQVSYNPTTEVYTITDQGEVYSPGTLMVAQTTDVAGRISETYNNSLGQTILKRVAVGNGIWLSTYFLYDQLGREVATIHPKAYALLNQSSTWGFTDEIKALITWKYYDAKGRTIAKETPGIEGKVYQVYDELNRLVLAQSPKQRTNNQWSFTKYDAHNRAIITGVYTKNKTRAVLQSEIDSRTGEAGNTVLYEVRSTSNAHQYYTNQAFPKTDAEILIVKYFDDYGFLQGQDATDLAYKHYQGGEINNPTTFYPYLNGQATGERIKVLNASTWMTWVNYYDEYGREIQLAGRNHLGGIDRTTTEFDFAARELNKYTEHNNPIASTSKTIKQTNDYNPDGTLKKVTHSIDGQIPVTLVEYVYNVKGEVIQKKVGRKAGGTPLQTIDYQYNLAGALTHVNDASLSTQGVDNDLFGMEFSYDYGFNHKNYDGNISGIKWKSSLDNKERAYGYQYDQTNRLTQADYIAKTTSQNWATINKTTLDASNELDHYSVANISYDANGNMQTLQRKGILNFDANNDNIQDRSYGNIDDLTYAYRKSRLVAVEDNHHNETTRDFKNGHTHQGDANNPAHDEYQYDIDGNLQADKNKGITNITYNVLNRPEQIIFGDASNRIEFVYDAIGDRLAQKVYVNGTLVPSLSIDYINGMVYRGDELQFIPTAEGRAINPAILGYNQSAFVYEYHYTDHLGNNRLLFREAPATNDCCLNEQSFVIP